MANIVDKTTTDGNAEVICGNLSCAPHSICQSDASGSFWCDCHEGFLGETCHEDRNECATSSTLCLSRGECVNTPGSFKCACYSGWEGHRCQHRDQTVAVVQCLAGFTGSMCRDDIDECSSSPNVCKAHQSCANSRGSYTCTCLKGWKGVDCADDVNECDVTTTCQNGGTCTNLAGGYKCHCAHGWIGHNCDEDIDECEEGRCLHGSTCLNLVGSFSCTCPPEWTGDTCDILPVASPPTLEQTRGGTSTTSHSGGASNAQIGHVTHGDGPWPRNKWLIIGAAVGGALALAGVAALIVVLKRIREQRARVSGDNVTVVQVQQSRFPARVPNGKGGVPNQPRAFKEPNAQLPGGATSPDIVMKTKLSMRRMLPQY
ncbi:fibropellin-1-like [Dreissena polymorpha]|uniref:fibropellin-1-like n=1 Tax=Dreissena polymorpha TaxID=45954 RepID=UPI002264C67D|nr:fibropellin-1-like [Dreissena polymorpha]